MEYAENYKIVVGYSGGVTSAWCLYWALNNYPRDKVVALFHDTKEEHPDTYRYLHAMAARLGIAITERSDGRSVKELEIDEETLANNRMAFCSRILKVAQRDRYFAELRAAGIKDITLILGFTADEPRRLQRATGNAMRGGYDVRFPLRETGTTKTACVKWTLEMGVPPSSMYEWSDHANCINCRRGGKAYIKRSALEHPEEFARLVEHERNPVFAGHTIFEDGPLTQIVTVPVPVKNKTERIDGDCGCGA